MSLLSMFHAIKAGEYVRPHTPGDSDRERMPDDHGQEIGPDGFNRLAALRLVADSPAMLRPCDLFRLFNSVQPDRWPGLANYILRHRPELAERIADTLNEVRAAQTPQTATDDGPPDALGSLRSDESGLDDAGAVQMPDIVASGGLRSG